MDNQTFTTTNRKLEQFLFVHDIFFERCFKTEDGMTAWQYEKTIDLYMVVNEYCSIIRKRRKKDRINSKGE